MNNKQSDNFKNKVLNAAIALLAATIFLVSIVIIFLFIANFQKHRNEVATNQTAPITQSEVGQRTIQVTVQPTQVTEPNTTVSVTITPN